MKSQYLEAYKQECLSELNAGKRPYSVGTFLAYRLRGNAKNWSGRYRSLVKGLEKDGWVLADSKLHGIAYGPSSSVLT